MEIENKKSYKSLIFIVLIVGIVFVFEYLHVDLNSLTHDQQHQIVLVYDTIPKSNKPKAMITDSVEGYKDSTTVKADSPLLMEEPDFAGSTNIEVSADLDDSAYFVQKVRLALDLNRVRKNKPVIRYFTKSNDDQKVYVLRKFGYYIHERVSPGSSGFESNAIYYGDSIKKQDLELVAYILIKQGVQIKEISRSKYRWKYNAIEIGTDTTIIKKPNILISELRNKWSGQ